MNNLFQPADEDTFLKEAYNFYRKKCWIPCFSLEPAEGVGYYQHREKVVQWLYKLGLDLRVLTIEYEQFKRILLDNHPSYNLGKRYHWRWRAKPWTHWPIESYRVLKKFTRKGEQKKDKRDNWLEVSGITRTRRKESGWRYSCKYSKQFNARKHRTFEKKMLSALRWDHLHKNTWKRIDWLAWD